MLPWAGKCEPSHQKRTWPSHTKKVYLKGTWPIHQFLRPILWRVLLPQSRLLFLLKVSFVLQFAPSMLESKVQLALPTENVIMIVLTKIVYTNDCLYSFWYRQKVEFCMLYSFVGTIANIFLAEKNWALLTDLLKVKNNMFLPDNCHTQKRTYSLNTHP